jgi:predicted Zn finger-like uncharacterized protein
MSLLTRCPACETLYRLVPDQLRISQGWVKCGQCSEIFDASQQLVELDLEDEVTHEKEECASTPSSVPSCAPDDFSPVPVESVAEPDIKQDSADPVLEAIPADDPMIAEVVDTDLDAYRAETSPESIEALPLVNDLALVEATGPAQSGEAATFLQEPRSGTAVGVAWIHSVLWLALLLLVTVLLGQWLYWERERLAATHPDWRPVMQWLCEPLACTVQALRRIDAIALDAAAFNKLDEGTYRLAFVIKNQSNLPLALPSVELSLTDVQEQTIVRRVLTRGELFDKALELPAGKEFALSRVVRIEHNQPGQRIVGYRLLAFYP